MSMDATHTHCRHGLPISESCLTCCQMRLPSTHSLSVPPPPAPPAMPHAHALFAEAERTISGPRRDAYGDATASFERVAASWSQIVGKTLTASQVALMMIAFKVCREANAHKHDNVVDICGYAGLLAELEAARGAQI